MYNLKFAPKPKPDETVYMIPWDNFDGHLYDLNEFIRLVKEGSITEWDGIGEMALEKDGVMYIAQNLVAPCNVTRLVKRQEQFTHVIWFNN